MSWKPASAKTWIQKGGKGDAIGTSQTVDNRERLCLLLMLGDVGFLAPGKRLGGGTELCVIPCLEREKGYFLMGNSPALLTTASDSSDGVHHPPLATPSEK